MGDLKSIGSEKLTGQAKINRIMEIARYGETSKNTELHIKTNSFTKRAADGNIYAIVHEKDGYYVKSGLNESSLDYVNGLSNKRKNRYRSYSAALKRLNLMLKPINEEYNDGYGDSMYEQEVEDEKFVLKQPESQAAPVPPAAPAVPAAPVPPAPAGGELPMDDMDDMEAAYDDMGGDDMGGDDMGDDVDVDVDVDMEGGEEDFDQLEQTPTVKSIQKLTGKLGQKMREYEDDMDSDMIKYVLNSVIAAVDLDTLDDEDRDDIVSRLEPELDDDYGMEDDFEADVDIDMDDDEDFDMGGEEIDMDMDVDMDMEVPATPGGLEESLKNKVNKTLKGYFKLTNKEKGRRLFEDSKKRYFIRESAKRSHKSKNITPKCETIEQELKVKTIIENNRNIKYRGKTKAGSIVLEDSGNNRRFGVTRKGELIK